MEPSYQPTNPELQVSTLQEKLALLQSSNAAMVKAVSEWSMARMDRDAFFYQGSNSLHSIAMAVKQQVKALFGNKSEAIAIRKIRFTKLYCR